MNTRCHYLKAAVIAGLFGLFVMMPQRTLGADKTEQPNIVFVYCDDLGYGDVQVYNPEHGKILTPSADKLASQGMMFTDAHSAASVCTPSRYALLTGRYSWRSKLQTGVARGYAPSLIDEDRLTVAGFLKEQGYYTAVIGKWHLNFQFVDPETGEIINKRDQREGKSPIGVKIPDGPTTRGFDFYHGLASPLSKTMPMMRSVVENGTVIGRLAVIDLLPSYVQEAVELIDDRAENHPDQPFFLYFSLTAPHTPIVPTEEWIEKQAAQSGLEKGGPYAAFVMQTDAALGAVMDALKRNGLDDNTMVPKQTTFTKPIPRWLRGFLKLWNRMCTLDAARKDPRQKMMSTRL